MPALILMLAQLAGKIVADQLSAHHPGASAVVNESLTAAQQIVAALAQHASTATNGELTADDVHTAYLAAVSEVNALVAEAEASRLSRAGQ